MVGRKNKYDSACYYAGKKIGGCTVADGDGAGTDDLQRKGRKVGNALVVENADLSAQESDSQQDNKDEDLLASRQDIAQHRIPSLCKMVSS